MAVFRSQLQGELLAQVLLTPTKHSITDLARLLHAPFPTVRREVARLVDVGILLDRRVGRSRLLEPNLASPAYRPLRDLVMVAFGPRQVVADEFADLGGVRGLFIFGSWAARYLGEPGPEPGDIDVLVVGNVDREELFEAAERAQRRLSRDVNPTLVSQARWTTADEPFISQVQSRPLVTLVDDEAASDSADVLPHMPLFPPGR